MKVPLNRWIGEEGRAFERVGLAFRAYGFEPPLGDSIDGRHLHGAYAYNIVSEYQADLSQNETLAVIEFGLVHAIETLAAYASDPQSLLYTIQELGDIYADTYASPS